MRQDVLDLNRSPWPDSLQPTASPGFPIRRLAAHGKDKIVLAGRRAVAFGDPSRGITRLSVDDSEMEVSPLLEDAPSLTPHPTVVEVGIDRLFRRWSSGKEAFEELWIVPFGLPFAVRRWKWGERGGGQLFWNPPADLGATERLRKVAGSWPAVERSWHRDISESATLHANPALSDAWSWGKARLLAAVHTEAARDGVRVHSDGTKPTSLEAAWVALGVCALGRSDLAPCAVRRISDLDVRAHTEAWTNRWAGNSGPHPDEDAEVFPPMLTLAGRTDAPLNSAPPFHRLNPVTAAALCGRIVASGLGIKPDSRFGRIRFGPVEKNFGPTPEQPLELSGLTVGQGRGSKRLDLRWTLESGAGTTVTHVLEVVPDAGATPLQVVFEPLLRASAVTSVWLDGQEVRAELTNPAEHVARVRLQCPLDAVRTVRIEVQR